MLLRLVALISCGMLALAGCSSDGDGGDVAAFCAFAEEQDVLADDSDDDPDEALENLRQWQALAPTEVADDIDTVADAFEAMEAFDEDDPDAFGAAFALMFDPRFLSAVEGIEAFLVEECGFDPEDFEDDFDDFEFDGDRDGGFDEEFDFGFDGDVDSDFEFGFGDDSDMVELEDLSGWLEANHGDAPWLDLVVSRFSVPGVIALSGDFDIDEALEACDAVVDYLSESDLESDVEIDAGDGDDLLVDTSTGSCAPV